MITVPLKLEQDYDLNIASATVGRNEDSVDLVLDTGLSYAWVRKKEYEDDKTYETQTLKSKNKCYSTKGGFVQDQFNLGNDDEKDFKFFVASSVDTIGEDNKILPD